MEFNNHSTSRHPSASTSTLTTNSTASNADTRNPYNSSRTISRSALQYRHYDTTGLSRPSTPPSRHPQSLNKGKAPALSITTDTTATSSSFRQPSGRSSLTDDNGTIGETDNAYGFNLDHNRDTTLRQSWSSVTRDSVVDNLLLSFDRMPEMSFATTSQPSGHLYLDDDDDQFSDAATPPPLGGRSTQRPRGHTYSSSMSSSITADDASSIFKGKRSLHGRRSGSSSSFMSNPVTRQQLRDAKPPARQRSSSETQRTSRHDLRSRVLGRPASKSSVASGIGHGANRMLHSERPDRRLQSRSPSRDNIATQSAPDIALPVSVNPSADSILSRGRPVPSLYSAYEGVGTTQSSRNASKSSKSGMTRDRSHERSWNGGTAQSIPQSIREQASEFVKANNGRHDSPVMREPAHALTSTMHSSNGGNEAAQQRPGFFRRVFGTSTRSSTTDVSRQLSRETSFTHGHLQQQPQPQGRRGVPPVAHVSSAQSEPSLTKATVPPMPAVVNKKTSFFRRRKKSISEDPVPPTIPQHFSSTTDGPSSPGASSLRKVLDRYLEPDGSPTLSKGQPARLANLRNDDDSDSLDLFHTGKPSTVDVLPTRSMPMNGVNDSESARRPDAEVAIKTDIRGSFATHSKQRTSPPLAPPSLKDSQGQLAVSSSGVQVSPLASPMYKSQYSTPVSPMASQTKLNNISPGATIRAVSNNFGNASSSEVDHVKPESKGLAIEFPPNARKQRLWIDSASEEDDESSRSVGPALAGHTRAQPPKIMKESLELHHKASVPVVELNGNEVRPSFDMARHTDMTADACPAQEDMDRAKAILAGEEESVSKSTAAAWLGEKTDVSARTLTAYMCLFDWTGQNILSAMRSLCDKLVLKGESQQVDRVLEAFANRWHECNPNNGFKGPSVIHNICYALLLLNTDQHVASIQHKMTRSEFIKNTMPPIKDAAEMTIKATGPHTLRPPIPWASSSNSLAADPSVAQQPSNDETDEGLSADVKRIVKRQSFRPSMPRNDSDPGNSSLDVNTYASNILINSEWEGSERGWLAEVETVLKSFYTSIVADALPLHGAADREASSSAAPSLSVHSSQLRRTGSILSKAPSESYTYRGRKQADSQSLAQRMHPKNRTRQKVYPASTMGSTRTSFDDGTSMMSPAGSSMWSRISTGKTQPTMSVESFARTHDFKQSLGFTNALSQAIIREEHEATFDSDSFHRVGSLLEDESLELAGAPWAKEGMVKHKRHLEGPDKKAKERSWNECFAVVEKGYLHLFSFDRATTKINSGTIRARARRNTTSAKSAGKAAGATPSVVGGGNWADSANEKEQFLLRQTIATTLPAPGYNKARPYVWALSLPNGSVHLFQVGTMEIAVEFATTANYWSARLSKEPLVGGVDNIEYGWSDNVLNPALVGTQTQSPPPSRGKGHSATNSLSTITGMARPSMSSISTFDQMSGNKSKVRGDRIVISDWRPPPSSMLPSQLMEIDQLRSLKAYITSVDKELERHNELRAALPLAYGGSGSARLSKVLSNWEKKSSYLLKESVKFRTYVEALEKARAQRERVYEERRLRGETGAGAKAGSIASS